MPSKKKKYNARFPAGRIKKIMQTDEEVGKVAQAVPVIISRTLELFVESLLTKSAQITQTRNAKTLTPSHIKQCILSESRFDFLKDLVKNIPDPSVQEDNENNACEVLDYSINRSIEEDAKVGASVVENNEKRNPNIAANFYTEQSTSAGRTPVIQYGPRVAQVEQPKINFSVEKLVSKAPEEPKIHIDLSHVPLTPVTGHLPVPQLVPTVNNKISMSVQNVIPETTAKFQTINDNVPPLIPISHNNLYSQSTGENNLYIDEDYDN